MKFIRRLMSIVLTIAGVLLIAFVVGSLVGFDKVWHRVAGAPDLGYVQFQGFEKGPKPNQALVCPAGLCNAADVDIESPLYDVGAEQLARQALAVLKAAERSERVDDGHNPTQMRFVLRTKLMKYPDTLTLETIEGETPGTSRIAIYSRSQLGESDLGVNLARVRGLLEQLSDSEATTQ